MKKRGFGIQNNTFKNIDFPFWISYYKNQYRSHWNTWVPGTHFEQLVFFCEEIINWILYSFVNLASLRGYGNTYSRLAVSLVWNCFFSFRSICFCSVTQSYPTLCNPMDSSKPGFPVLHYLLELAQILVHWVSDAIQLNNSSLKMLSLGEIQQYKSNK